jgi:endoglucanase
MMVRLFAILVVCLAMQIGPSTADDQPAFDAAQRLGRGVNVLGYDGLWDGHVGAPFKFNNFRRIRSAGFQHVRINFHAFRHMNAEGIIAPIALGALDDAVTAAIDAGLIPIIDEHDHEECDRDVPRCGVRLVAFWRQIAERYRGQYPSAMFEILNEPGGNVRFADWSEIATRALATIRSIDRERFVIVAALNSQDPPDLEALPLPESDRRIILTVHYYKPFDFTHQGALWMPDGPKAGKSWGSAADLAAMASDFAAIDRWAKAQRRPVYLGEFGVYDAARMTDRVRYLAAITRAAERMKWPWAAWQFDHDFAVFNTERDDWNAPVLKALMDRR